MAGEFLLVTIVTGSLLVGAGVAISRIRGSGGSTTAGTAEGHLPAPAGASEDGSEALALALVVLLFGGAIVAAVVDPVGVVYVALPLLIAGYLAWGIYSLARIRGIPHAHSVGVSAWLIGVVLVGVVAVKLLLG